MTPSAPAASRIHVALLRAVNVAGHQPIGMADLRTLLTRLGFSDARSLLASGNLVFRGGTKTGARLERLLEAEAAKRLALETDFFVRTADEWQSVIAQNPFPDAAARDPAHLVVLFLKNVPDMKAVKALQAAITGREVVRAKGAQAYLVYPDGIGRSRLTLPLIEKHLATRGTGRNWNTVLKVGALTQA
jgi:uncharacterized protein (DUF1697 family)